MSQKEADLVRAHYNATIAEYDTLHAGDQNPEHMIAMEKSWPYVIGQRDITSVLDVGCGTGRLLNWLAAKDPSLTLHGIDPSEAMCAAAAENVPKAQVQVADGAALPFADGSVDLVIATGILHHIGDTHAVIAELFRVARHGVIVSDHNEFAMGSPRSRRIRLALHALGLQERFNYIRQGFKRQRYSVEDGWYYPYSVLSDYGAFAARSADVVVFPTRVRGAPATDAFVTRQSHVCMCCLKEAPKD